MAYRPIDTNFWTDPYIIELSFKEKSFYLYLLTNINTKQCGIYQISFKQIQFETGLSVEQIIVFIEKFTQDKKIAYSKNTSEIALLNWKKYNENKSWKSFEKVRKELNNVKNKYLTLFLYDPRLPLCKYNYKDKVTNTEKTKLIENPHKDFFKDITDNEIISILSYPILDDTAEIQYNFKPKTSPIEGVCKGHARGIDGASYITEHNITNSKQNITNSNSKQIQNKTKTEQENQAFPEVEPQPEILDKLISFWNEFKELPECRFTSANLVIDNLVVRVITSYSEKEIKQAILNYFKVITEDNFIFEKP